MSSPNNIQTLSANNGNENNPTTTETETQINDKQISLRNSKSLDRSTSL